MKLVIAEKPSVARDIAAVIGANESSNGVLRGNGYIVSSAVGHLVRLKKPEEYDTKYEGWSIGDLPIVPDFEFVPIEKSEDVLERLTKLMNSAEVNEIIEATDAGREGECIFRYIYNYIGCKKPVKRLWISSMTEQSIQDGFANLRPYSDYDKMFDAGITRNKIDWLWGINLTRLYTSCFRATCSIGRCQTAVVNMIVQRDNDIANFIKKPFFKLKLANGAEWFDDETDSFPEKSQAESVKGKCENQTCTVISADTKLKKENRPLLFSLTSLQTEANEKLGFTAAYTLEIMQSLYEKKLLTYPRTDSNYLTDDMKDILPELVSLLHDHFPSEVDGLVSNGLNIDGRIINNSKVSDHHAIIPTENIANIPELSDDEKAILNMVMTRFLAALSAQYEYEETEYVFEVNGEKFRCKTKKPVQTGWKAFYADKESGENVSVSYLQGESFTAENLTISECETQPPKHFTESTLLKAMENIDRRIEDKELSEYVSERGLGTPATRSVIIERVITVGFVERKNKSLIATDKGKKIISLIPDEVKSIEMTAAMELQLSAIANGTATADEVISAICDKLNSIISLEKSREHVSLAPKREREVFGVCPKCGANVYKFTGKDGKVIWYCGKSSSKDNATPCIFRLYEDDYFFSSKGKKITDSIMKALLAKKKSKVSGFKSEKTGKTYDAIISFKDYVSSKDGKTRIGFNMEFDNTQKKTRKGGK